MASRSSLDLVMEVKEKEKSEQRHPGCGLGTFEFLVGCLKRVVQYSIPNERERKKVFDVFPVQFMVQTKRCLGRWMLWLST